MRRILVTAALIGACVLLAGCESESNRQLDTAIADMRTVNANTRLTLERFEETLRHHQRRLEVWARDLDRCVRALVADDPSRIEAVCDIDSGGLTAATIDTSTDWIITTLPAEVQDYISTVSSAAAFSDIETDDERFVRELRTAADAYNAAAETWETVIGSKPEGVSVQWNWDCSDGDVPATVAVLGVYGEDCRRVITSVRRYSSEAIYVSGDDDESE